MKTDHDHLREITKLYEQRIAALEEIVAIHRERLELRETLDLWAAEVRRDPSLMGEFEQICESDDPVGLPPGFVRHEGKLVRLGEGSAPEPETTPTDDGFDVNQSFIGRV
ncbi:MAG: hypothetical protein AAGB51_13950 [Planctomycetota bacterium]